MSERDPMKDYMEFFGELDEITEARMKRRFESYLEGAGPVAEESEDSAPEGSSNALPGSTPSWLLVAAAAAVVVGFIALSGLHVALSRRIGAMEDSYASSSARTDERASTTLIAPGEAALDRGDRVHVDAHSTVERLLGDGASTTLRLMRGAIDVSHAEGPEVVILAGLYVVESTTSNDQFRVEYAGSRPTVVVTEGAVRLTGWDIEAGGILVTPEGEGDRAGTGGSGSTSERVAEAHAPPVEPDAGSANGGREVSAKPDLWALYNRAKALRSRDPERAVSLFRKLIDYGESDPTTDEAFAELLTLLATPAQRERLRAEYHARFPNPDERRNAEHSDARHCKDLRLLGSDNVDGCWARFYEDFPDSVLGP